MSELDRRGEQGKAERSERRSQGNQWLYLTFGIGFTLAAIMVIATAEVLAAGIGFVIPAAIFYGLSLNDFQKQRQALPKPVNRERELLSAIRDNDGSITPAEAAMETSLTVREADAMLSELAGGGHLVVESRGGSLFYALPRRDSTELEGR